MKQTWLVTGTHTGFGKHLAIRLAQRDDVNLVATARKVDPLDYLNRAAGMLIDQAMNHSDQLPTRLPLGKTTSDLASDKYTQALQQFKSERALSISTDQPEGENR